MIHRISLLSIGFLFMFFLLINCGGTAESSNERPRVIIMHSDVVSEESEDLQFTDDDFKEHMKKLSKKVPTGFTTIVQPPFMVIGDESAMAVKQRSEKTIKWAVDMLK